MTVENGANTEVINRPFNNHLSSIKTTIFSVMTQLSQVSCWPKHPSCVHATDRVLVHGGTAVPRRKLAIRSSCKVARFTPVLHFAQLN